MLDWNKQFWKAWWETKYVLDKLNGAIKGKDDTMFKTTKITTKTEIPVLVGDKKKSKSKVKKSKFIVQVGQYYSNWHEKDICSFEIDVAILALVDFNKVALICLNSGNRWDTPVEVKDSCNIISKEWKLITNGRKFELITREEAAEYVESH